MKKEEELSLTDYINKADKLREPYLVLKGARRLSLSLDFNDGISSDLIDDFRVIFSSITVNTKLLMFHKTEVLLFGKDGLKLEIIDRPEVLLLMNDILADSKLDTLPSIDRLRYYIGHILESIVNPRTRAIPNGLHYDVSYDKQFTLTDMVKQSGYFKDDKLFITEESSRLINSHSVRDGVSHTINDTEFILGDVDEIEVYFTKNSTKVTSTNDTKILDGIVLKDYLNKIMSGLTASLTGDAGGDIIIEEDKITHTESANKVACIADNGVKAYISEDGIVYVTDYDDNIVYEGSIVDYLIYDFSADNYDFIKLQSMVVRHKEIREYAEIKYRESISG